ncbi:hypothetical protein YC2023_049606 [Brassica napus]
MAMLIIIFMTVLLSHRAEITTETFSSFSTVYFAASEIYNAIRVFIAAYAWMTGFGNFSYYYIRKDFSLA